MNMKENKGFTLVELIVVIAILGILAAVAVPAYTGYITKAHDASAITKLDALNTAVEAANATQGELHVTSVSADGKTVNLSSSSVATSFATDFATFYGTAGTVSGSTITFTSAVVDFSGTSFARKGATNSGTNGWTVTP